MLTSGKKKNSNSYYEQNVIYSYFIFLQLIIIYLHKKKILFSIFKIKHLSFLMIQRS